ncbi:MAG: ribosome maturation factor RimP [Pseudohongiellaceae bacterium]|jgi:ribosome maturation factor RimP
MARPLFTLQQYADHKGERVKVKLRVAFEGRRNFTGQLAGVEDDDVIVIVDDHEYLLPFDTIDKGNIVPQF